MRTTFEDPVATGSLLCKDGSASLSKDGSASLSNGVRITGLRAHHFVDVVYHKLHDSLSFLSI